MSVLSCANSTKETMMMDKDEKIMMHQEKIMNKEMTQKENPMKHDNMMNTDTENKEVMKEGMKQNSMEKGKDMMEDKTKEKDATTQTQKIMKKDKM
jgi:hypothetical protein